MPKKNETPTPEIVTETIQAPHQFTDEEMLVLGRLLVESMKARDQVEREFDSTKAEFKGRLERAELETNSLLLKHAAGFEMRPTVAVIRFNHPATGRKTYERDDDGKFIREDAMTSGDMEQPLFKDADGKDATAPEDAP